jgi:hypothetical protein
MGYFCCVHIFLDGRIDMNTSIIQIMGLCCVGVFMLAFAGGGIFLISRTRKSQAEAAGSNSWPSTAGVIEEATIQTRHSTDSDGSTNTSYSPHVRYSYRVGGADYSSTKISFGFGVGSSNYNKAQQWLAGYPQGKQVPVYYDPANPQNAVLERAARGSTTGYVLGVIFIALGICMGCPVIFGILMSLARVFQQAY